MNDADRQPFRVQDRKWYRSLIRKIVRFCDEIEPENFFRFGRFAIAGSDA
jgi:hypothetical protein